VWGRGRTPSSASQRGIRFGRGGSDCPAGIVRTPSRPHDPQT
jgi:hypothetical protein